jgi:murein DD-endopeptidase MepM/ murein hydrolase activator NlpD
VLATADGTVIYMNQRSSLSNYGIYLVLRHVIQGVDLYSLYAHLSEIRSDLEYGDTVRAGEPIATMGRTTNTKEGISRERAHLHFEINLVANEKFPQWYKKTFPTQRNDHGAWNGRNLLGLDARLILLQQEEQGTAFDLVKFIQNQTELCRVLVRRSNIPWTRRYPMLVQNIPTIAQPEAIAGYEIVFNYAGVPIQLIPRVQSEIKTKFKYSLLSVNKEERKKNPGRRIVALTNKGWKLDPRGIRLLDLLTFQ